VAQCFLDKLDIAEEMTKSGTACDWPKFSGGRYKVSCPDLLAELTAFGCQAPEHPKIPRLTGSEPPPAAMTLALG
jgi:hypothetical protein